MISLCRQGKLLCSICEIELIASVFQLGLGILSLLHGLSMASYILHDTVDKAIFVAMLCSVRMVPRLD